MTPQIKRRNSNDVVATLLLAAMVNAPTHKLPAIVEGVLNRQYPARNCRAASTACKGATRANDPTNSVLAARAVKPARQNLAILKYLASIKRAVTADTISENIPYPKNSASTRMKYLVTTGLVEIKGSQRGSAGRQCSTYAITPEGRVRVGMQKSVNADA